MHSGYGDATSDTATIKSLATLNDPQHKNFDPTVFVSWDTSRLTAFGMFNRWLLQPYIRHARKIVRVETDIVMLTHLILYFTTSVPSAALLYHHFTYSHAIVHWLMQSYYVGTYTLMMHQHIHAGGILSRRFWWIDAIFPYITDPLMGHTWNSYYYHHVKHHHVEGNGPNDLSSTLRYQRDSVFDFLCYYGRFLFLVWLDLPLYFIRKGKRGMATRAVCWEIADYMFIYLLYKLVDARATVFVFVLPLMLLRAGLMVGNWGQHALVDEIDPNSDFRSSITLIDVAVSHRSQTYVTSLADLGICMLQSNRFCYNDGYHTSHHLNPRRHWRDHPMAFISQKERYINENALVFRNIDYLMMTVKLLQKDYMYLAKSLVPIGNQIGMSMEQKAAMLRTKTRRFTEEDIQKHFCKR